VIARIAGHVRAGGMGIVGACDLAIAAEGASFAFTEARIGLAPAMISLTTLDIMDSRQAMRYYLTGETFGASVAARLGLITAACAGEELDGVVGGLVAQLRETSPQGAAETKMLLTAPRRQRLDAAGPEMAELSARLFGSQEAQEGIRAFLEKRAPAWRTRELARQVRGDGDDPGAQVLPQALGLRVGAGRGGHAGSEQAVDDEVEGQQVRQLVAVDLEVGGLGEELAEPADGQVPAQPRVGGGADRPQAHVRVAALVAGPGAAQPSERDGDQRAGRLLRVTAGGLG
jgi:enoyl-CoA hydratase